MNRIGRLAPLGLILLVAVGVRAVFAASLATPVTEDAAAYVGVARALAVGRGLVSDTIWSYLVPPLVLPRPAFDLWGPLTSLVVAPVMAALGTSFRVATAVTIALGTVTVALIARLAGDAARDAGGDPGRGRVVATTAGLGAALGIPFLLASAIPDSTTLFGLPTIGAALLTARLVGSSAPRTRELVGLGVLVGLAALARSDALWLGIAVVLALAAGVRPELESASAARRPGWKIVVIPLLAAGLVVLPWAIRQALVFGTPFPSAALANALFVRPTDVAAYADLPTLDRYLAQGLPMIAGQHLEGLRHDLVDVLLIPSLPLGPIGLVALPWTLRRSSALRPLAAIAILNFLGTSLLFPVATLNGTYLHAALPAQALLVISAVLALAELPTTVARRRRRSARPPERVTTRPSSGRAALPWLLPLGVAAACLVMATSLSVVAEETVAAQARDRVLASVLPAELFDPGTGPIVTDAPLSVAESFGRQTLALPDEPVASVVALARRFGARYVVVMHGPTGQFATELRDGAADACLRELPLEVAATAAEGVRAWRIDCP